MKGGLLQLATVGKEDSVLIKEPEIFHFKKVYYKYTNFSINNNLKPYGQKKFDTKLQVNIDKSGDLLKDVLFYLEIPYFNIAKKIKTTSTVFNRTQSDKIYYNTLDYKTFVYFKDSTTFYLIPEVVLYNPHKFNIENIDGMDVIEINSKEYQKYFSKDCIFKKVNFVNDNNHPSINYLKTLDDFWFNCFINSIIDDKNLDDTNIVLMDYQKFTIWFSNKVDNRLFFDYQHLFNFSKLRDLFQINLLGDNNRIINEVKKYFEINEKIKDLNSNNYTDELLDIDFSVITLMNNYSDLTSTDSQNFILNTVQYNVSFLLFLIKKQFDDIYSTNNNNFFSFYHNYRVNTDNNNSILSLSNNYYINKTWDTFTDYYFKESFNNLESKEFNSFIWSSYQEYTSLIEKNIESKWQSLNLISDNYIPYIYSVIFTFINRFENINNNETLNFLDFFTTSSESSFSETLDNNFSNYTDTSITDLKTRFSTLKNKYDITTIYCYVCYELVSLIEKELYFEKFDALSKQNIQFLYWWRNKILNQIFLRYKRNQSINRYQDFSNISSSDQLVNFSYTYIPNNLITLNEIRKDLYRVFFNYTYYGSISNDANSSSNYRVIEKISQVTTNNYSDDTKSVITGEIFYMVDTNDFYQDENKTIIFTRNLDIYPDNHIDMKILYEFDFYNVNNFYLTNGLLNLELENKIDIDKSKLISGLKVILVINLPISKYYFGESAIELNKYQLVFETNRNFYSPKYIDANNYDFNIVKKNRVIDTFFDLSSVSINNTYSATITNNNFMFTDLFNSNYSNYSRKLYHYNKYSNTTDTSSVQFEDFILNGEQQGIKITFLQDSSFEILSNGLYYLDIYGMIFSVRLRTTDVSNQYIATGAETSVNSVPSTDYSFIEYKFIFSPNMFTLNSSSNITLTDGGQVSNVSINTFTYTGSPLENSNVLLLKENKYYQVNLSRNNNDYTILNYTGNILGAILIDSYSIDFNTNLSLDLTNTYVLTSQLSSVETEEILLKEVFMGPLTQFENSLVTSIIQNTNTIHATTSSGISLTSALIGFSTGNGSNADINILASGKLKEQNIALAVIPPGTYTLSSSTIIPFQYVNNTGPGGGAELLFSTNNFGITTVSVINGGSGYFVGDIISINSQYITGANVNFSYTISQSDIEATSVTGILVSSGGLNYSEGDILEVPNSVLNSDVNLIVKLKEEDIDLTRFVSNFSSTFNGFKYKLISKENQEYQELIGNPDKDFTIKSNFRYQKQYDVFRRNNRSILLNLFVNGDVLNVDYFDTNQYTYYFKIIYNNNTSLKKKIVFSSTQNQNDIFFEKINENNDYLISDKFNLEEISNISIQLESNLYKVIKFQNCSVFINNNESTIHIPLGVSTISSPGSLTEADLNNEFLYKKYASNSYSTFYLYNSGKRYSLSSVLMSFDGTTIFFKILSQQDFLQNNFTGDLEFIVYSNNNIPNLISNTSFYLQEKENRVHDLMDYFIQTPMLMFLDHNIVKNGSVILKNLPFNLESATIEYLKLDDEFLHLNDSLYSNQLIRYKSNFISSAFDNDIINHNKHNKTEILTELQNDIIKILSSNKILQIIETIEFTDRNISSLYENYYTNIKNITFGKTIENVFTLFNNKNYQSKNFFIEEFKNIDYNLFTKKTLDFYGNYDTSIGLNFTLGTGKDLFVTNYRPLLNTQRLDSDMLDYLKNFSSSINQQINYINNNKLWLNYSGYSIDNKFDYFYSFQQLVKNDLYFDESKCYKYELQNEDEFVAYPELTQEKYLVTDTSTIKLSFDSSNNINILEEIKPVKENKYYNINPKTVSNYDYTSNQFNYLGPGIIENGKILNGNFRIDFSNSNGYIFVDDCKKIYEVIPNYNGIESEFNIYNPIDTNYTNSYLSEIEEVISITNLGIEPNVLFLYEFSNNYNFSFNDFILIDNQLTKVISTEYGKDKNIAVISKFELEINNVNVLYGKKKNYDETKYQNPLTASIQFINDSNILVNKSINLIDFNSDRKILGKNLSFRKFNYSIPNVNSYLFRNTYCSVDDGILKFEKINNLIYTYLENTSSKFYKLGKKVLFNTPLKCRSDVVDYFNIYEEFEKDTIIYYDSNITELKDIDTTGGPINDNSNSTLLINSITSYPSFIQPTTSFGLSNLSPTTNGKGKNLLVKLFVSGKLQTTTDNFLTSIVSSNLTFNSGNAGTLNNLSTTSNGIGSGCIFSITTDGNSITSITVTTTGTFYNLDDLIIINKDLVGSNMDLILQVKSVNLVPTEHIIDSIQVQDGGIGYKVGDTLTLSSSIINSNTDLIITLSKIDINQCRDIYFFNGKIEEKFIPILGQLNIETKEINQVDIPNSITKNMFICFMDEGPLKMNKNLFSNVTNNTTTLALASAAPLIVSPQTSGNGIGAELKLIPDGSMKTNVYLSNSKTTTPSGSSDTSWTGPLANVQNSGPGSGAVLFISIVSGITYFYAFFSGGSGYMEGDVLTIPASSIPNATGDATLTLSGSDLVPSGSIKKVEVTKPGFGYKTGDTLTVLSTVLSADQNLVLNLEFKDIIPNQNRKYYNLEDFNFSITNSMNDLSSFDLISDTAFQSSRDYYTFENEINYVTPSNYNVLTNQITPPNNKFTLFKIQNQNQLLDNNNERLYDETNLVFGLIIGPLVNTSDALLTSITINTVSINATTSTGITNLSPITTGQGLNAKLTVFASGSLINQPLIGVISQPTGTLVDGTYNILSPSIQSANGSGATFQLTVTGNIIVQIIPVNLGSGYFSGEIITIVSNAITGATGDCTITLDTLDVVATSITGVTVTNEGYNYRKGDSLKISTNDLPGSSNDLVFTLVNDDIAAGNLSLKKDALVPSIGINVISESVSTKNGFSVNTTTNNSGNGAVLQLFASGGLSLVSNALLSNISTNTPLTATTALGLRNLSTITDGFGTGSKLTVYATGSLINLTYFDLSNINQPTGTLSNGTHTIGSSSITKDPSISGTNPVLVVKCLNNSISEVQVTGIGSAQYYVGDVLTVDQAAINGATSNWSIDISSNNLNATSVTGVDVTSKGSGYFNEDILEVNSADISGSSSNLVFSLVDSNIIGNGITGITVTYPGYGYNVYDEIIVSKSDISGTTSDSDDLKIILLDSALENRVDSVSRNISILNTNNLNKVNKLRYKFYSDPLFTKEIPSEIRIKESDLDSSGNLITDKSIFLNFEEKLGQDPLVVNNLTLYYFDNSKISFVNIENDLGVLIAQTLDSSSKSFLFTLDTSSRKFEKGQSIQEYFQVKFNYLNNNYEFDMIVRIVVDDTYNQILLNKAYDSSNFEILQEPFIVIDPNGTTDIIKDSSGLDFYDCDPKVFKVKDYKEVVANNVNEITNIRAYDKYVTYVDVSESIYSEIKDIEANVNNDVLPNWELITKAEVNKNIITLTENVSKYFQNKKSVIIEAKSKKLFLNIREVGTNFIRVNFNFELDITECVLYLNFHPAKKVERQININNSNNIIYTKFGGLRPGEVIVVNKLIVLLIKNYDMELNGYTFENLIPDSSVQQNKIFYQDYFSHGMINNFSKKIELLNYDNKNEFVNTDISDISFGDFVFNNQNIGFYDPSNTTLSTYSYNYTLGEESNQIIITRINSEWYYFGSKLGSNSKVICPFSNNQQKVILTIEYIYNYRIKWKGDYNFIFNNYLIYNQPINNNEHIFFLPYNPFKLEKLQISHNKTDIDIYTIIESASLSKTEDNLLPNILVNTTTVTPTTKNGITNIPTSTNGLGECCSLILEVSGPIKTTTDQLLNSIVTNTTQITQGTYSNLSTTTDGKGSDCVLSITASGNTSVTSVTVTTPGKDYNVGDFLYVSSVNIPGSLTDLVFRLKETDIVGTTITGVTVQNSGKNFREGDKLTVLQDDIPGASNNIEFIITTDNLIKYCTDPNKRNGIIEISDNYYLIDNHQIIGYNGQIDSGNYRVFYQEDKNSIFNDTSLNVYDFKKVIFEDLDFYVSNNLYVDGSESVNTEITSVQFNKTAEYYVYSNNNYLYPVYLVDTPGLGTYYINIIKGLKIYYNSNNILSSTTPPANYQNLNGTFYYQSGSLYYYPLHLDINKLANQNLNNDSKNLTVSGTVESYIDLSNQERPFIITSNAKTVAIKDSLYSYTIQTNNIISANTVVTAKTIPSWLSLSGLELSGTPTELGSYLIELDLSLDDNLTDFTRQTFILNVIDNSLSLSFTSEPKTFNLTNSLYSYTISVNSSEKVNAINLPNWLELSVENNIYKISGIPNLQNTGENKVVLQITDSGVTVRQQFTIFVYNNVQLFIVSSPDTNVLTNSEYFYELIVSDFDSDINIDIVNSEITIINKQPSWLTYSVFSNRPYYYGTAPNNEGDYDFEITICDNLGRISTQKFTISVLNNLDLKFGTYPKTSGIVDDYYEYEVGAIDKFGNHLNIIPSVIPDWLCLSSDNILYGTPRNCDIGESKVILKGEDLSGNYVYQKFSINVIDNKFFKIKLNDGIYQTILKELNLKYKSKIMIEGKFFTINRITDFYNYSEIIVNERIDIASSTYLIGQNKTVNITFPINNSVSKDYSINNKLVNINNDHISYSYKNVSKTFDIYCYYYLNNNQEQLKIFNANYETSESFSIVDSSEVISLLTGSNTFIFIENYIQVKILNTIVVGTKIIYNYLKLPFTISQNKKLLIEEIEIGGTIIVHLVEVLFTDGILMIDQDISNEKSIFYINRIIPVRIINKTIQLLNPQLKIHSKLISNCSDNYQNWVKIPISIKSGATLNSNIWYIEITSNYIELLDKFEIFSDLPHNNPRKFSFFMNIVNGKPIYQLLSTDSLVPNVNATEVYVVQYNKFKEINKLNNIWNFVKINVPQDRHLEKNLTSDWSLSKEVTKIPVTITDKSADNKNLETFHYIITNNYQITNFTNYENLYLDSLNLNITNFGSNTTGINTLGPNITSQAEIVVEALVDSSSTFLYYEKNQSENIIYKYEEPTISLNTYIEFTQNFKIDPTLCFNNAKNWEEWTSVSFDSNNLYNTNNQNFKKLVDVSDNSDITFVDRDDALLLTQEILLTSSFISKCKLLVERNSIGVFTSYNSLIEIRKVEKIIYEYLMDATKEFYFWRDPINNINKYIKRYIEPGNSFISIPPYRYYKIYKNCLINNDPAIEPESGIDSNPLFEKIDDESIQRICYFDSQYVVKKVGFHVHVYRIKSEVDNEIENFINSKPSYFGVDSHKLFRYISKVAKDLNKYVNKLLNNNYECSNEVSESLVNYNYNILTPEKLIISRKTQELISNPYYNNFNLNFIDYLYLNYYKDKNYNTEDTFNGISVNNIGEESHVGLSSFNRINQINTMTDTSLFYNLYNFENYLTGKKNYIDYDLSGESFYKYLITSSDNINFNPEYSYKIDSLEGTKKLIDYNVSVNKYYDNGIEFYSDNEFKNYDYFTLKASKNYDISEINYLGFYYENLEIPDLSSAKVKIFLNDEEVKKISSSVSNSGTKFDLVTKLDLKDTDVFKIELLVMIKSVTKITVGLPKSLLVFTSNLENSNLRNISNFMYIKINSVIYRLQYDSTNGYYLDFQFNDEIDTSLRYNVFVFYTLSQITNSKSSNLVYDVILNEDLESIDQILEKNSILPQNFLIDNNVIDDITVLSFRQFYIYKNSDTDLTNGKILTFQFHLERYTPLLVTSVEPTFYILEISNKTKTYSNSVISLKKENYDTISGTKLEDLSGNDFIFKTDNRYSENDLIGYNTEIESVLNITSYTKVSNTVSFTVQSDFEFPKRSTISYYVDISGSYGLVDNSQISLSNYDVSLVLPDWGLYTPSSTFNLKQVDFEEKTIRTFKKDENVLINLENPYYMNKNDNFDLRYLDSNNKEAGNYIYYFTNSTVLDSSAIYNLEYKNTKVEINYMGTINNDIYFATVDKLEENSDIEYSFYDNSYIKLIDVSGKEIKYFSDTYCQGTILDSSNNNFNAYLETKDASNVFLIDSNLIYKVYMSIQTSNKNSLELENKSNIYFEFPDELRYNNYFETVTKEELKIEEVIWDEEFCFKFFKNLGFYLDDQLIDTITYETFRANQYYTDKKIKLVPDIIDNKFVFYLPTHFWFKQESSNFLPIISLGDTNINLKMEINKIENLIQNDVSSIIADSSDKQLDKKVTISMLTDTILLSDDERKKFAEYNHEYLIQRNKVYPKILIHTDKKLINLPIKGLIKDIFWFARSSETDKGYLTISNNEVDQFYAEFLDTSKLYNLFVDNNRVFTNDITTDYKDRFLILDKIISIIQNTSTSSLLSQINNHPYLSKFDLTYTLYLYFFRLSYYDNMEISEDLKVLKKFSKLILYYEKVYKSGIVEEKINPIKKITFKANGKELLAERNINYFNSVMPYQKFNGNSYEFGDFLYSFSLYPTIAQPSGELNFNVLKESSLELELDSNVINENIYFSTFVKEYQILRIISGQPSLSWI